MNQPPTTLGIDLGTGSVKVASVRQGRILARASRSYPVQAPHPGWALILDRDRTSSQNARNRRIDGFWCDGLLGVEPQQCRMSVHSTSGRDTIRKLWNLVD